MNDALPPTPNLDTLQFHTPWKQWSNMHIIIWFPLYSESTEHFLCYTRFSVHLLFTRMHQQFLDMITMLAVYDANMVPWCDHLSQVRIFAYLQVSQSDQSCFLLKALWMSDNNWQIQTDIFHSLLYNDSPHDIQFEGMSYTHTYVS